MVWEVWGGNAHPEMGGVGVVQSSAPTPEISPSGLIPVRCIGTQEKLGTRFPCRHTLAEVPPSWGPVVVTQIPDRWTVTGKARVEKCEECKTWVEVRYLGLERQAA